MGGQEPRATIKALITIEDVLNSRMIAYPFRLRCCLVTDGGGLDLVTAERARDFPQSPYIAEHNTAPIGKLPLNTNGGGLSYMHSGMYALQESARQMRGSERGLVQFRSTTIPFAR